MTGMNVFLDYDEKGNARTSVGLELRASAFEAVANYYKAFSGGQKVGDFTERASGWNGNQHSRRSALLAVGQYRCQPL